MTILVTGATGNVGRAVVRDLVRRGAPVRAMTRDPDRASLPEGVEVVRGDLGDLGSVESALAGADALHLINYDASTGAHLRDPEGVVALSVASGVRRVTTFRGEAPGRLEDALVRSGLAWTDFHVPVEFMTNVLGWTAGVRDEGLVRFFGSAQSAVVDPNDVGAAIATALIEPGLEGWSFVLTGPEVLSTQDKVDALARMTGRPVRLLALTEEEARAQWRVSGTPEDFIDFLVGWHASTPESARAITPDLQRIVGRAPRRFEEWAQEHRDAFRQSA